MYRLSILSAGAYLALNTAVFAAEMEPLKIAKECSEYSGENPSFCTVTESSLSAIPVGTKILYYAAFAAGTAFSSSDVVLAVGPGDSAVGRCIVYDSATPVTGLCAFVAGSGTLSGFQAIVRVSVDDQQLWHWEGGHLMGVAQ